MSRLSRLRSLSPESVPAIVQTVLVLGGFTGGVPTARSVVVARTAEPRPQRRDLGVLGGELHRGGGRRLAPQRCEKTAVCQRRALRGACTAEARATSISSL